jgi:molybdopterin-guanine dinucleotide biosynthesis protein A
MITKGKHQKHPKLVRSTIGHYHRSEWAIYGTNCNDINIFFDKISVRLSQYSFLYVDADHGDPQSGMHRQIGKKQYSTNTAQEWNDYDDRLNRYMVDAAFINGNHYPASRQIVIINPNKEESLKRRVDQLDNLSIVVVQEDECEIFDFVKEKMSSDTLVFRHEEMEDIIRSIAQSIEVNKPELKAAILVGGKSQRMGMDKSKIIYHDGISQEDYLYQLLSKKGIETYLSKSHEYEQVEDSQKVITDRFINMGPYGAIVSAMISDPNAAWLVIACDLPFLDGALIDRLIQARNPSKYATAFRGKGNPFPEPLITIYEPKSYQRFLSFLSLGYACPRKVLINSDIEELELEDQRAITNVNTQKEMEEAKERLENG